jgi:hypothetical protein
MQCQSQSHQQPGSGQLNYHVEQPAETANRRPVRLLPTFCEKHAPALVAGQHDCHQHGLPIRCCCSFAPSPRGALHCHCHAQLLSLTPTPPSSSPHQSPQSALLRDSDLRPEGLPDTVKLVSSFLPLQPRRVKVYCGASRALDGIELFNYRMLSSPVPNCQAVLHPSPLHLHRQTTCRTFRCAVSMATTTAQTRFCMSAASTGPAVKS